MLAKVLEKLIMNSGKITGALIGFVLGLVYIKYGFINTLIVAFFTLVGYNSTDILLKLRLIIKKIKKLTRFLLKKLKEED